MIRQSCGDRMYFQRKCNFTWFYILWTVHLRTIWQINPTRCTILFNICIYFPSLHISGIHVPIIRRKIAVSMRHWYLSLCMCDVAGRSFTRTSRPEANHTEWQIPVSYRYRKFSWWWTHGCPKLVEKRNK